MSGLMGFNVYAEINGPVCSKPAPIRMRYGDNTTPTLNVRVSWWEHKNGNRFKRDFNYTGYIIQFEAITPGGVKYAISSAGGGLAYFDQVNPSIGHFKFVLPPELVDAVGPSGMCYFRFVADDLPQVSTGNFIYTVYSDIFEAPVMPGGNYPGNGNPGTGVDCDCEPIIIERWTD